MTRDEYVGKLKAQLDHWNAEVGAWEAKAKGVQAGAQAEYEKQLEALREQRDQALQKMREVQSASLDAWSEMAKGADEAWKAMHEAFERARGRFGK